jgi:hypothetical protein
MFTLECPRIDDNLIPSRNTLDTKAQPNHGVLVEPLLEFLELLAAVPADPGRVLSVTCAEEVECLLQRRPGEDGIEKST